MDTARLRTTHADAWRGATRHAFLDAIREGTVGGEVFRAWLAQDCRFVGDLLAFQARLLGRAPRPAQAALASGLVALEAELSWFEAQARERDLALDAPPHPVTAEYGAFLRSLEQQPYAAAITALWALERAYLDAWRSAAPGHPAYRTFVEHWTVPAFSEYVTQLAAIADAALAQGTDVAAAKRAFLEVTRLERAFWDMAWTAESAASAGQGEPLDVVGTGTGTAAISAGRLAQALWQENADLAQAALEHPFVRGIADGTLPRQAFQGYVAQDAFFLTAFARAYALALARSPDQATARLFSELLSGTMDELRLHAGYASRWAITLDGVVPNEATLAYTDFLLATAALGGVGETCAALTPCMRLYAFLGQSLAAGRSSGRSSGRSGGPPNDVNPYAEWIRTYAAPGFDTLAAQLEALLNQHAAGNTAVRTIYRRAMRLEVAFFDASARAVE